MPADYKARLGVAVVTFIFALISPSSSICQKKFWFGPNPCRYKCHCEDNHDCNRVTGVCPTGCEEGCLGPACQYDNRKTTCNDRNVQSVTVLLDSPQPLSWVRLVVKDKANSQFKMKYTSTQGVVSECPTDQTAVVDDTSLDISCPSDVSVQLLTLSGSDVGGLCLMYISGGRNVALKQERTEQSWKFNERGWFASYAVDGRRRGDGHPRQTCTHTQIKSRGASKGWWTLKFSHPVLAFKYVIYNRYDCCWKRLNGFFSETWGTDGKHIYTHRDNHTTEKILEYTVLPESSIGSAISNIRFTSNNDENILTLCEVEVYGDVVCAQGKYGRECEHNCNCADRFSPCLVSSGGCPSGCAPGYRGEDCWTVCPRGKHGLRCRETCSSHCKNNYNCNHKDGRCPDGCQPGYVSPLCKEECPSTKYGQNCAMDCSTKCWDRKCDHVTGHCGKCRPGYVGEFCDEECPPTKYGQNCTMDCSTKCVYSECDHVTGHCGKCWPGYVGEFCDEECPATKYGQNCTMDCSTKCVYSECDHVTGHCGKCWPGYVGEFCDEVCPATYHGEGCMSECSVLCSDQLCHPETGMCYNCTDLRSGDFCEIASKQPKEGGVVSGGIAIGGFVVGLFLILVVTVVVWRWRKHNPRRRLEEEGEKDDDPIEMNAVVNSPGPSLAGPQRPTPGNVLNKLKSTVRVVDDTPDSVYNNVLPSNTAVLVSGLREYLLKDTTTATLKQQFEAVPQINSYSQSEGLLPANIKKNRYKNIVPYNHARVLLRVNPDKRHGDYINASYVKGYTEEEKFIAAQAPTDQTLEDFVRMLWEREIDRIVMLTNLVELRKTKCTQYWPVEGEEKIGEISVRVLMTQVYAEYTIRHLLLTKVCLRLQLTFSSHLQHGEGSRDVLQFHFTAWPDKSVPDSPWGLVDFYQRVLSEQGQGQLLVHCSAGVGRTGTFIGLCNLLQEAEKTGKMDFVSTLWKLRQDRMMMIQTLDQYVFMHHAALIGHVTFSTVIKVEDMKVRLSDLEKHNGDGYARQFKSLAEICCDRSTESDAKSVEGEDVYMNSRIVVNRMKNRLNNVLPNENYRPILTCEMKNLGNYVNAVLIPSFRKDRHNILTQVPLPSTVNDFWRLVTQYHVGLVVAFEADSGQVDETVGQFLPSSDDEPIKGVLFDIQSQQMAESDLWREVFITVFKKRRSLLGNTAEQHQVMVLLCKKSDLDPITLLDLLKKVKTFRSADNAPTLYMCRNGATMSGLACVQSVLLDRLESDQCLTVPLVVGAIKAIRPQVIPTVDQYWCLHQVLKLAQDGNIGHTQNRRHCGDPCTSASNTPNVMGQASQSQTLQGKGKKPLGYRQRNTNGSSSPSLAEAGQEEEVKQEGSEFIPTEGGQVAIPDTEEDQHTKTYANL